MLSARLIKPNGPYSLNRSNIVQNKKIQYFSDIHLEKTSGFPRFKARAPYLCLLGDIGNPFRDNYKDFLRYCSDLGFKRTFIIAGNHEYYGNNYTKTNDRIQDLCNRIPNVSFLNRSILQIDDLIIAGSTLWSQISVNTAEHLNDFNRIYKENGKMITREDYLNWHYQDQQWLKNVVSSNFTNRPLVVMTHHLPSYQLIVDKYQKWKYQDAFATELDSLQNPVDVWLCGHSHCVVEKTINGVRCGINAGRRVDLERTMDLKY